MPIPDLDCWYLSGATASGKTQVALELARLLDAEIVSLDSMAVYREMDIGTAKPSEEERGRVSHHLIDVVDPDEEFSVSDYLDRAEAAIGEIRTRGREVLFVGGTPLYLKAMLRGLYPGPPADWDFRRQVRREVKEVGVAALHERLMQVDPLAASHLHPNDVRRIIRALEVNRATGQPISHKQTHFDEGIAAEHCKVFVLDWPRAELHGRINTRVDRMFDAGLVDETRRLLARFGQLSRTAWQAVGYREVADMLAGRQDARQARTRIKTRTRQFAKRQETWFRSLAECRRMPQREGADPSDVARQIANHAR